MKNLFFPAALLVFSVTIQAQVTISTAVDSSLYVGIDNPVVIHSSTIPVKDILLRAGNAVVTGQNGNFNITCSKAEGNTLLEAIYRNKVVATKKISIHKIEDPVAFMLGEKLFTDTAITIRQLEGLKLMLVKCNYPLAKFTVLNFTAEIIHNGKGIGTISNDGNNISHGTERFLGYAEIGDLVIFDQIVVQTPDAVKRYLPPVRLRVVP